MIYAQPDQEGSKVQFKSRYAEFIGGEEFEAEGALAGGYSVQPSLFEGHNRMRIFQEESFGPVVSVTSFSDAGDAGAAELERAGRLDQGSREPA